MRRRRGSNRTGHHDATTRSTSLSEDLLLLVLELSDEGVKFSNFSVCRYQPKEEVSESS